MVLSLFVRRLTVIDNVQVNSTTPTLFKLGSTQGIEFKAKVDEACAVTERMPDARRQASQHALPNPGVVIKIAHFQNQMNRQVLTWINVVCAS
jgi:hypothetical protein